MHSHSIYTDWATRHDQPEKSHTSDHSGFTTQSQVIQTRRKKTMNTGGLSRERLVRMHTSMTGYVERGEVPGIVMGVRRHGELYVDAVGKKTLDGHDPVQRDTIFRIASMSKPITAA